MKIFYVLITLLVVFCILLNISLFRKKTKLEDIRSDYSFIIGKEVICADLQEQMNFISNNYILCVINPTCESCYVKINRWNDIVSKNRILQNSKVIFWVVENEFERLNEIIENTHNLKFIFDCKNEFLKNNPYFTQSQTYLISQEHRVLLCGEPLNDKVIMNLFLDEM